MKVLFTHSAFRQFKKLNKRVQRRIDEKLLFYISQKSLLAFAEPLRDSRFGQLRFRIGDYRVLFDVEEDVIIVLKVGHRRDFYK